MAAEVLTTDDLREFKLELLDQIQILLSKNAPLRNQEWIKSNEVKNLLGVSSGTLANLRSNGTIPYTKIGGIFLYNLNDILDVLDENKSNV